MPHSAADNAGLRPGDRLRRIGDRDVSTNAGAYRELSSLFADSGKETVALGLDDGRGILRLSLSAPPARSRAVHPTQIYSTIGALLICLLLLAYDPFRRRDGELSALMLTVYSITRFLEEMVRTDEAPILGTGMTISQNVSLLLLVGAMGLWYYVRRRRPGLAYGSGGRVQLPSPSGRGSG